MKYWLALISMFSCLGLMGQDTYHRELLEFLKEDFAIEPAAFLLYDTEQQINQNLSIYGNKDSQINPIQNFTFSQVVDVSVKAVGTNIWDSGINIRNATGVKRDDIILVAFWAKHTSMTSELKVFAENSSTFEKEIYFAFNLTPDWTQYFAAFKSSGDFDVNGLTLGFHIAAQIQQFQIAGFTGLNFGPIDLKKVPSTFSPAFYGGYEADAPWRVDAASRIEEIRKKDLCVKVFDANGAAIPGALVEVEMQKHEFGFGSALVGCRFPGNRCYNPTYVEKVLDLDGEGHGFNVAVTENALKWDAWEENWIGTPDETVSAIQWLTDQGITTRGHTLVWPGWNHMPDDMLQNQEDVVYLNTRLNSRIEEMINHPVLSKLVTEWDVLNEITHVRDLEMAFSGKPDYVSGRELYIDILKKVENLQPDFVNYINDYVVLSGGGAGNSVVDRYKSYLDEILESGAKFDGIGFQAHIGTHPTSIYKVEDILDEFFARYGKRMKITEYDINDNVDDSTQAIYLADFLTMIFSHPGMDAFIMWGFWDGNHWKNNAPIFNLDWSIKPSGEVFIDKVFREWWTNASGVTSDAGSLTLRPFKGMQKVTVTVNGESQDTIISTLDTDTLSFSFESTPTTAIDFVKHYQVYPNPVTDNSIQITSPYPQQDVNIQVYSYDGKLVLEQTGVGVNDHLDLDLAPGIYWLKIDDSKKIQVSRVVVL
ncbi:MAG: T9SS type A sorting domain-containing protein [Saprospiraceae bacterium]|nr:T9SS type A sorting domain-containing protein [Saprospiraceae bacterium]